ncbi:hypothetical protein OG223_46480 [Streptomyces sp. NBC_01478]|uniref:hypothetical protein n=1 Tax=Streptomyces sp. NBC_01478 TaxID=2903882 RepID=UPI002E378CE0|nr:hypothetical protein [Streptomyces sp. NBC_01478]
MAAAARPDAVPSGPSPYLPALFFDTLAAFTFAKDEFPARKSLFGILAATYMIPGQLSRVPQFVTMAEFG